MKKAILLLLISMTFNSFLFSQNYRWINHGGSSTSNDGGTDLYIDKNENIYVVGGFNDTAIFSGQQIETHGAGDIFIAKYDKFGNFKWIRSGGGTNCDGSESICGDNEGNIYLNARIMAGGCDTVIFDSLISLTSYIAQTYNYIVKYDSLGIIQWTKQAGRGFDIGGVLRINNSNNIYCFGSFDNNATFDGIVFSHPNNNSSFIAKYDINGNFKWVKELGGTNCNGIGAAVIDTNNNCYVIGCYKNSITLDTITLYGSGYYDHIFIAKLDSNANVIWAKSIASNGEDQAENITLDINQNIIVTGTFSDTININSNQLISKGDYDIFLAKYSPIGNNIWAISDGAQQCDEVTGLTLNNDNDIYISGYYPDTTIFNNIQYVSNYTSTSYIAKYNNNGNCLWFKRYGNNSGSSEIWHFASFNNNLYTVGCYNGTMTFDTITIISSGGSDFFMGKIIDLTNSGLEVFQETNSLTIYPNPAKNNITLEISKQDKIEISNIEGQIIKTFETKGVKTNLDISDFPNGVYIIKATTDKGTAIKKFIKE